MKCFNCGEQIQESTHFCPFCGQDQSKKPQEALCPNCQRPVEPNDKFCTGCGSVLSQPKAVEEEIVVAEVEEAPAAEAVAAEVVEVIEETPAPQPEPIPEPAPAPQPAPQVTYIPPQPAPQPAYVPPQPAPQPAYVPPQPAPQYAYVQPQRSSRPALQLPDERSLWKMLFLGLLTFGIYPMVVYSQMSVEINMVASRHDGKRTIHFMWVPYLAALTLGIYSFVWIHGLCERIGDELIRRGIAYKFSAATFWLWNILYPLIGMAVTAVLVVLLPQVGLDLTLAYVSCAAMMLVSVIGPFVYMHKNMKAMNLMNADYNEKG